MGPIIAWMFVAVLVALGVLAFAGSAQNASGFRGFLGDLRRESSARSSGRHEAAGLGQSADAELAAVAEPEADAELAAVAEPEADAEPVDVNIEEFFSLGLSSGPAYVSIEEIQEVLARARGAAVRRIPILNR